MRTSGVHAFLEILAGAGVRYIFGNPGTTELPLNDAILTRSAAASDQPPLAYVLGLQEIPVMSMADGYAMASRPTGGGQLAHQLRPRQRDGHALQRLSRGHAADRHRRPARSAAAILRPDPRRRHGAGGAGPGPSGPPRSSGSKTCHRQRGAPCKSPLTPPTGPVFLSLPVDVQMEIAELDVSPPLRVDVARAPAGRSGRARGRATARGAKSRDLGWQPRGRGRRHRRARRDRRAAWRRGLFRAGPHPRPPRVSGRSPALRANIAALVARDSRTACARSMSCSWWAWICCANMCITRPSRPCPAKSRIVHVDADPAQFGKNFPTAVGVWGDAARLAHRATGPARRAAHRRTRSPRRPAGERAHRSPRREAPRACRADRVESEAPGR